jgi:hypothetical protein
VNQKPNSNTTPKIRLDLLSGVTPSGSTSVFDWMKSHLRSRRRWKKAALVTRRTTHETGLDNKVRIVSNIAKDTHFRNSG